MTKSKRTDVLRGIPAQHLSADCRSGNHLLCSGSRYIGDLAGRGTYGRCKCRCHG